MAYDIPVEFRRIYSGALDSTAVFNSTSELNGYLVNPARYAGQVVTLVEGGTVTLYKLSADTNSWEEVQAGSDVTSVNAYTGAVVLDTDDIDDTNSTNKYVTQAQITNFHTHANASILNGTEESFTTELLNTINNFDTEIDGGTF